jgi:DNA helicase-2/ATP-dependent DNA helicase PcrA
VTDEQVRVTPGIDANQIADALGRPRPTDQQRAVIESPLGPALVVAGAGSGKTETMASRVLWLLANGLVRPGEILGLTFTRKAAGELATRIRERIASLAAAGMLIDDYDPFEAPTVATYNSYANALYRDNAAVLGRESDGAVLGEAAAWQLTRNTVLRSRHPKLADLSKGLDSVTRATLGINRALAENVARPEEVRAFAHRFGSIVDLPAGGRGTYAAVDEWAESIGSLDVLLDLAEEYDRAKSTRGLVEYSDQVALALDIIGRQPQVVEAERNRYRVVLLDEYQDTSVVQTTLLSRLFSGHPVMAVGDPNQSIYGWRGASASNLDEFATIFDSGNSQYSLSTSWRNGRHILQVANSIVAPFTVGSRVLVDRLTASPSASAVATRVEFVEDIASEAKIVAHWLAERLDIRPENGETPPSAAILFRTRKNQGVFLTALREQGIPYHVLGVGGLIAEPEIADLVSALAVVHDPSAGLELIRLLAGSRWRIGVQDLHALNRLASWLRDRDYALERYDTQLAEQLRTSVADGESGSIVDALDFLQSARVGHGALDAFSELGLDRLRDAGKTIARLRSRAGLDLPDFVAFVLHELQLDIEVAANDFRALGNATIDAFFEAISDYLAIDDVATLGAFLSWLREAELREDLSPRPEDPEPGTVQILTIHGSKGLEWDLVVVPRMVDDELPSRPVGGGYQGWLTFGQLPWPFRGDSAELPAFEWEGCATRKEIVDEQKAFSARVKSHLLAEERRLAYVAVTRARHRLLLTGSFWATQRKPRVPSIFLRELAELGIIDPIPEATELSENPRGADLEEFFWPLDPLGSRRRAVEAAAEAVLAAEPQVTGSGAREIELLLAERRVRLGSAPPVTMPTRVPASRFKDYVTDPSSVASALRRPMPEKPYRATQLGTLFHSWVEDRYGVGGDAQELDASPIELDEDDLVDNTELAHLKQIFEVSDWAGRKPVEVEREIHLPFDGQVIVCKIDAVYSAGVGDDGAERFEIVDWKTGKVPRDAHDLDDKQLQLALYRLAYSRWSGVPIENIDAVFYYVTDDVVIRPDHLDSADELLARWQASLG